jgi:hypothetical protein
MQKTSPIPRSHFQFIMDNPISTLIGAGVMCFITSAISSMFIVVLGVIFIFLVAMFLILGLMLYADDYHNDSHKNI